MLAHEYAKEKKITDMEPERAAARAEIELLRSALADIEHGKLDDCAEQGGPPDGYSYTREDMQHIAKATLGAGEVE